MDTLTTVLSIIAFAASVAALAWWLHHKTERDAVRWERKAHHESPQLKPEQRDPQPIRVDERPPHAVRLHS